MERTTSTSLGHEELTAMQAAGLFDLPEVATAAEAEAQAVELLEDLCLAESEPRCVDHIAELFALAEEFEECVSHTETADLAA